jgi:translation initiation factor 1 (eIF-1/SUI1)
MKEWEQMAKTKIRIDIQEDNAGKFYIYIDGVKKYQDLKIDQVSNALYAVNYLELLDRK